MTGSQKLEELIKSSKGIITSKIANEHDIHREYLSEYVEQGKLERISHGIYIAPHVWEDRMLILQLRKHKMIYSHETALHLHKLTVMNPRTYHVTVPTGYNTSKLHQEGLIVHTIKKDLLNMGICSIQTDLGNEIRLYNMERTICDILRDRNHQDTTLVSESLKGYLLRPDRDLAKLMQFASYFRIDKILNYYLEVLL